MTNTACLSLSFTLAVTSVLWSPPAEACDPILPFQGDLSNLTGREDVPTNAVVTSLDVVGEQTGVLRLADGSEQQILALDFADGVGELPLLSPSTSYVLDVYRSAEDIPAEMPPISERPSSVIGRIPFTTGTTADEDAPPTPSFGDPDRTHQPYLTGTECIGFEGGWTTHAYPVTFPAEADALVALSADHPSKNRVLLRNDEAPATSLSLHAESGTTETWDVAFVDAAGNRSPAVQLEVVADGAPSDCAMPMGCSQGAALPLLGSLLPLLARRRRATRTGSRAH